jgi:DNA-binding response OmpR family regulator
MEQHLKLHSKRGFNMDLQILIIDDEEKVTDSLNQILKDMKINDHILKISSTNDFENGKMLLSKNEYDILILDIFKGNPSEENPEKPGEEILDEIRKSSFIPIIFFSGLTNRVRHLESGLIRVVTKTAGGNENLIKELEYLLKTNIPLIKKKLNNYIKECMRDYFWDFVLNDWEDIRKRIDEISLGYLLLRRIAKSFTKEKIKEILGERQLSQEKIFPMEYYIYPLHNDKIETGDILIKDNIHYIVLTPSCDIAREKADMIHLAECIKLEKTEEYLSYVKDQSPNKRGNLKSLIESRKSDRYFFLPKTHFIDNCVVDFQRISSVEMKEFENFKRITKLDDPFAQSMIGFFIRYFNRIGTPDIDSDYVIEKLI